MRNNATRTLLLFLCFLASATGAFAQIFVKGVVKDKAGETIIGANITVKGTTIGTVTDYDGNYSLNVPSEKSVIVYSYVGTVPQEKTVGKNRVINVTLEENSEVLDEVVVVGYGTVRKGDLTGSISSIKPDENDASKVLSVSNLLQGKIAGVSVGSAVATPGAASSVTIRGANSLRGDNQPLYIIDNIPQSSTGEFASSAFGSTDFQIAQDPLTSLNPADIEDIQVLKDASATAIYGSRGANGVIIITTKKGKSGKAKVNVSANYTIATATDLKKMLNLEEYAAYRNERAGSAAQFYPVNGEMRYIFSGGTYDADDPSSYRVLTYRNWQKEVYRDALSQNYAATVSGGNDATTYYISASFKDINGLVRNTGLKQGDLRANLSMNLSKSVTLKMALNGSVKENDMMSGGDTKGGATGSVTRTAIDSAPYVIPDDEPNLSAEQKTTVWSWINDYDDITKEKTFRGSLDLLWNINKYFSYNARVGGDYFMQNRGRWYGLQLFKGQNDNGSLGLTNLNKDHYTVENLVNFKKDVKRLVNITATVGVTYDDYGFVNKITTARDFENTSFRTNGLHMAGVINEEQPIQKDYQLLSYLGRANLSFVEGRYLLTATFRADGTSKFQKSNRWAYFPSVALAWRLEQEKFIRDNAEWVDQLKLRVGYGQTGNQSIDPYNSFYDYQKLIDYASSTGSKDLALAVSNLQNASLKWETTSSYSAGLDFGFLRNRLSGTLEWYYKETDDLLIERSVSQTTGFGTILMNQGSLSNRGVELSLSGDIIRTRDLTWTLSGNIAFNKSKIGKLGLPAAQYGNETYVAYLGNSIGDHFGVANIFIEGKAPGLFWGYKTDGIINTGDEVVTNKVSSDTTPGNIKYVDSNGDGVIDENDKVILGDPNPDFTYGFQTTLAYRDFTLSAAFNGVYGNQILNSNIRYEEMPSLQTNNLTKRAYNGAWREGMTDAAYPSVNSSVASQAVLDRYIEDGSFLRCTDITLNYALPKKLIKKIGFEQINVFASVKNAFVLTNYSGYDPEVNTFAFDGLRRGIDMNSFPQARSYIFGLNVTF
jgi:TonB-linked SusC/RagA family outer membrane protein